MNEAGMAAHPALTGSAVLALLELLDRDGQVRQSLPIRAWPVHVGRALDSHLVLDDAHVAAHHLTLDVDAHGAEFIEVGDTVNGLQADGRRLAAGERMRLGEAALRIELGDSHLRVRLARHALAPELPLPRAHSGWRRVRPLVAVAAVALALLGMQVWLDHDPEVLLPALGRTLLTAAMVAFAWCGAWALLSKLFTRRSHLRWHVWVLLVAFVASVLLDVATRLLAFALSWPALTDYAFVLSLGLLAATLYFHLLGLEPQRRERVRAAMLATFGIALVLNLWFNHQSHGRFGQELYMTDLFPPALRLAHPVEPAHFLAALAPLQERLDDDARRPQGDAPDDDEDE